MEHQPNILPDAITQPVWSQQALAAATSAALADVLQERMEQIDRRNHTAEDDLAQPVYRLIKLAVDYALIARDRAHHGQKQSLTGSRRKAVQAAALLFAHIDRIDAELKTRAEQASEGGQETSDQFILPTTEPEG